MVRKVEKMETCGWERGRAGDPATANYHDHGGTEIGMINAEEKPGRDNGLKPGMRYPLILQVCVDLSRMLPRPLVLNRRKVVFLLLILNMLLLTPVAVVVAVEAAFTFGVGGGGDFASLLKMLAALFPIVGLILLVAAVAMYGVQSALTGKASFWDVLTGATFGAMPITVWALFCYLILLLLISMTIGIDFSSAPDLRESLTLAIGQIMLMLGPAGLFCAICWSVVESIALFKEIAGIRVREAVLMVLVEFGTILFGITITVPLLVFVVLIE